jgi:hypothetical protein
MQRPRTVSIIKPDSFTLLIHFVPEDGSSMHNQNTGNRADIQTARMPKNKTNINNVDEVYIT